MAFFIVNGLSSEQVLINLWQNLTALCSKKIDSFKLLTRVWL